MSRIALGLLLMFVLACSASAFAPGGDAGKATVYVYRYSEADHRFSAGVYINEKKAAKLGNGRWVKFELDPGTYTFRGDNKQNAVELELAAGDVVYLRGFIHSGKGKNVGPFGVGRYRLSLERVPAEQGRPEVEKQKPANPKDVYR